MNRRRICSRPTLLRCIRRSVSSLASINPKLMKPNQITTHRAMGGIRKKNIAKISARLVTKHPLNNSQAIVRHEPNSGRW